MRIPSSFRFHCVDTAVKRLRGSRSRTRKSDSVRSGTSLVETMIFAFLGLVVTGTLYYMLQRGMAVQDATGKSIELMQQARRTMEWLTRDVHQAMVFLRSGNGDPNELVIILDPTSQVHATDEPDLSRLKLNDIENTPYPFLVPMDENVQKIAAVRVRYVYHPEDGSLERFEQDGILSMKDDAAYRGLIVSYKFQGSGEETVVPLASDIVENGFSVKRIALDRAGRPRDIEKLKPADFFLDKWYGNDQGAAFRIAQTCLLFVRLHLRYARGLYGKDRKAEEFELATKIISYKKVLDAHEREWFSSADEDMRY